MDKYVNGLSREDHIIWGITDPSILYTYMYVRLNTYLYTFLIGLLELVELLVLHRFFTNFHNPYFL